MASYQFNPINILDTSNATSLTDGGSMTLGGGISIGKDTFIGGNVSISGTTTSFSDNILLVNKNPSTSTDTGIIFQRYTNDIQNNDNYAGIIYSEQNDSFNLGYLVSDADRNYVSMGSLASLNTKDITAGNINFTGNLYKNGALYNPSQWTTLNNDIYYTTGNVITNNLIATNISGSNLRLSGDLYVGGTLSTVNVTTTNVMDINISTGTINVSGLSVLANVTATNSSVGVLIASTGITTASILNTGLISSANLASTTATVGTLRVVGTSYITNAKITSVTAANIVVPGFINTQTNTINTTTIQPGNIGVLKDSGIHYWSNINNISDTTYVNWGPIFDEYNTNQVKGISNVSGGDLSIQIRITGTAENDDSNNDLTGTFYIANSSGNLISTIYEYTVDNAIPTEPFDPPNPGSLAIDTGYITVTIPQGGLIQSKDNGVNDSTYLKIQNPYVYINVVNLQTNIPTIISTNTTVTNITSGSAKIINANVESATVGSANITSATVASAQITNLNVTTSTIATARITTALISLGNSNTVGNIFTTGGNVGISTTSPGYTLDVSGTGRFTSKLTITGSAGTTGFDTAANDQYADMRVIRNSSSSLDKDMYLQLGAGATSTLHMFSNNSETMTIKSGNVGIATASPVYTLDVSGTGRFTTALLAIGNSNTVGNIFTTGGNVGISTTAPSGMLHLNNVALFTSTGNLTCTGDIISFGSLSDQRLKQNVLDISNDVALQTVRSFRPVTFDWRDDIFNESKRNTSDVGFIAQQLEPLVPLAVSEYNEIGSGVVYKRIKHERLIPYLVGAIKSLDHDNYMRKDEHKIEALQQESEQNKIIIQNLIQRIEILESQMQNN